LPDTEANEDDVCVHRTSTAKGDSLQPLLDPLITHHHPN